ncbi:DUF551 domain-containing protein [Enterobacter kobei]|uniref:DUF551 domain-containing protein n=1 Tax=Enterobacter kobei TaxID=208224 RepID=UPI0032AEE4BD
MSNITRERAQEIFLGNGTEPTASEERELARIALASLEAEPVCVIDQSNLDYLKSGSDADVWPTSRTEMGDVLLYRAAPPAPVSVPTFDEWLEIRGNKPLGWVKDAMRESYDACRAAMLQGADGNSPVIPDGWVACSERMPDGMQTVITSNGFDIGQGWWDGEGWNSFDLHDVVPGEVTHWMPLPVAPQQDVK